MFHDAMDLLFNLPDEVFKKVTEEVVKTLHKSEVLSIEGIESNVVESIKEEIRKLIIFNNYNLNKVADQLKEHGWEQQKVNLMIKVIEENKGYLLYSMLLKHNSTFGDTIIDYNWVMKLVFGTSELKVLKYPLLQMELSTMNSSGEQTEKLYEFCRESLSKLIMVMENCLE